MQKFVKTLTVGLLGLGLTICATSPAHASTGAVVYQQQLGHHCPEENAPASTGADTQENIPETSIYKHTRNGILVGYDFKSEGHYYSLRSHGDGWYFHKEREGDRPFVKIAPCSIHRDGGDLDFEDTAQPLGTIYMWNCATTGSKAWGL